MPFDRFIPARISNISPHHCESTACYHCEEEEIEGSEPTVHIRLPCFTSINIHASGGRLLHWQKRQAMNRPNGDHSCHLATTRAVLGDSQRSSPLDRCSQEVSNDFHCSCNFRCCCRCDGNFLWRSDLAPTPITKLTFQQVGDELERLMPFTRKFLPNPYGKDRRCALSCDRSLDNIQALIYQNKI